MTFSGSLDIPSVNRLVAAINDGEPSVRLLPRHLQFRADGTVVTSDSTLRFRNRDELE